jgi:AraC-like DNA-binding protein
MSYPTLCSRFVPRTLGYAIERGVDVRGLVERFALPHDAVALLSVGITTADFRAFCEELAALLDEPFLGMKIALSRHNRLGGTAEAVVMSCPDVRTHFEQLERLTPTFSPASRIAVVRRNGDIGLEFSLPGDPLGAGRENNEWAVVRALESIRTTTRVQMVPTRVWFSHGPRPNVTPLVDYFGTMNIHFNEARDGFLVDVEAAALRQLHADPAVLAALDPVAAAELAARKQGGDLLESVRTRVRADLANGAPGLDVVAKSLGLSVRTLQRRLGELGTSLVAMVEDERRELAIQRVLDERTVLETVPATLGYEHKEAFWRAFKRWTGKTPARFRRDARASI